MKASRTLTATAAFALVAASTLLGATAANAADLYVDAADVGFVADGSPYLDSWFSGDVAGAEGTAASSAAGLTMTPAADGYQLLNGLVPTTTGLETLIASASFTMSAGDAAFQIPMFFDDDLDADTNLEFTTLRPVAANTLAGDWQASGNIMANDGTTVAIAANTATPLADILAATPGYEILAFGIFASTPATVASITWDGNTHWFLPTPTATVAPASLTIAAVDDSGVTGTFTGFVPGESVQVYVTAGGSSGSILATVAADAAGVVTYTHVGTATAVGSYSLGAAAPTSGINVFAAFAVTANAPVLAATGAESVPMAIGAVLLLLVGGGLVVMTARRRRALNI